MLPTKQPQLNNMNSSEYKILIVDGNAHHLKQNVKVLAAANFQVQAATSGVEAISLSIKLQPHLILLEIQLPGIDGIETCTEIRKNILTQNTLVAFFTTSKEDYSQIAAFDSGADDYIITPISKKVLLGKIKALLRRSPQIKFEPDTGHTTSNNVQIDREQYSVYVNGEQLFLPRKEFELLALLHSKPQKVFTREEIYQSIWGNDIVVGDRTIDVHIRKLREKLGEDHIHTVKGVGYRFLS